MGSGCRRVNASGTRDFRPFERVFSNGKQQARYIREIIFGRRGRIRFYHLTTDPATLPPESTWYIMTNVEGKIQKTVGNTYGLRTWIEYGFKHAKNELGWTDYRVTDYASIERWWEIVSSAYLLVSLPCPPFQVPSEKASSPQSAPADSPTEHFQEHRWWDNGQGGRTSSITCGSCSSPMCFTACSSPGCCFSISLAYEQASLSSSAL